MKLRELFTGRGPLQDGLVSTFKTGLVSTVIGIGWRIGHLQLTVNIVIGGFVMVQGWVPYAGLARSLGTDRRRCLQAVDELQVTNANWLAELAAEDMREAGSVYQCLAAVQAGGGIANRDAAVKQYMTNAKKQWKAMLLPTDTAAHQTPMLGLGGSLLGIIGMLSAGASDAEVQAAMVTMFSSTLIGCGGSFLLSELAAKGSQWIDQHVAAVELIVNLILDGNGSDPLDESDFESLF